MEETEAAATEETTIDVVEQETELAIRDKDSNQIVAKITVGQMIPYAGLWLRVIRVAEGEVTMRPEAYTGKRIKKILRGR